MVEPNIIVPDKSLIEKAANELKSNLYARINFALKHFPYKPSNEEKDELYKRILEDIQLLHAGFLFHANIITGKKLLLRNGYYFKTQGQELDIDCTERCMVKDNGTMIGSITCQSCEHHLENDKDEFGNISWLKCAKIEEAIKNHNSK